MKNPWIAVARDVVIILILTFVGGLVIGVASVGRPLSMAAIGISNLLLGTVGFCIAGCLTKRDRWKHLLIVAFAVWIAGLINVFFFGIRFDRWVISLIALFIMMAVGGGLSFLFVRQSAQPEQPPPIEQVKTG